MRRRTKLITLAVVVAGVAVGSLGLRSAWQPQPPATAATDFRWSLPRGTRLVYDLAWSTSQRVPDLAPASVEGYLELAGKLELRGHGRRGDAWLVEARLTPTKQQLEVVGRDVLAEPGALGDRTAWAELADDGTIRAVEVAADAPAVWHNVAASLLGAIEVVVPRDAGPTWSAVQRGPFGSGEVGYAVTAPRTLARVRGTYTHVEGLSSATGDQVGQPEATGEVRLGAGHLEGIEEQEHLVVRRADGKVRIEGEARLTLALTEVGRFDGDAQVSAVPRKRLVPGQHAGDADAARQALVSRVDGLTAEELMAGVLIQADGGVPDEDRWMWRASGLLRLEPALCGALAELFAAGRLGREGRAVALDLLAGAATPEAQAAMRAALVSKPARDDARDWVSYMQRLSFLDRPTPETVAFVRELRHAARAEGDVHGERAAAYVQGNLAGSIADAGDVSSARSLADELVRDLASATTPAARAALLAAYGAARRPEVGDVATRYLADADAEVRRSAVGALAEISTPGTQAALVSVVGDRDAMVQGAVLAALGQQPVSGDGLAALGRVIEAGGIAPMNDLAVAAFAATQRQRGTDLGPLATALETIAQRSSDPQVLALLAQATR